MVILSHILHYLHFLSILFYFIHITILKNTLASSFSERKLGKAEQGKGKNHNRHRHSSKRQNRRVTIQEPKLYKVMVVKRKILTDDHSNDVVEETKS